MGKYGFTRKCMSLQYYPILLLLSISILFVIISSPDATARDYQEDLWSEDIQVTDDYGATWVKSMMNVQETSDGGFRMMYETESGTAQRNIGTATVDKMGRNSEQWNDTLPLPLDRDVGITWFVAERGYAYRYVEEYNRLHLIGVRSVFTVGFFEIASDGTIISERELIISDIMDADGTERFLGIVHATWDGFGNAHCLITTKDWTKDSTDHDSYSLFYVKVSWHPFAVLVEKLHTTPILYDMDVFNGYLYQRIDVSEQGHVAVAYLGVKGSETHRFLTIKDIEGNWTTVSLKTVIGEYKYFFGTIGSVLIDENLDVHITWAETTAICYARTDINCSIKVQPRVLSLLPVSTFPRDSIFIKPIIQSTSNGDLLIAFNHCPQTAAYTEYSYLQSEVHLIVVPGGDVHGRNIWDITLCKEWSSSEAQVYIDEEDNIFVFWFDKRTGTTEIFMRYLAMPGISIEFDPSMWVYVQTIRPDETKVVNLGVRNFGSVEVDTIISVETDAHHEWWIWLDRYTAHVEPSYIVQFNLTVHCPADALHGETVTLWINVTTTDFEYKANIQLTMTVVWDRGLSVHRDQGYRIVKAGEMTSFHLMVYNIGELNEAVMVTIRHIGSDRWTYSPNDMMMILGPGEGDDLFINVTSPENSIADDTLLVVLEFYFSDGSFAHEAVFLRTVVQPTFLITMYLNVTEVEIPPGATEAIGITVGNVGNVGGTAFVEVTILTDTGDWVVLLEKETLLLRSNERKTMALTISAPIEGRGGDMLVVRVRAYSPKPFSEVTREVVAKVDAVHRIQWSEMSIRWDLFPGDEGHRRLTLLNDGNVFETIKFRMDVCKPGWSAWVETNGVEIDQLRIGPGDEVSVQVLVAVDYEATTGLQTFHMHLERGVIIIGNVTLQVFIRQVYDLKLRVDVIGPAFVSGGTLEALVTIINVGNGMDTVGIELSGLENATFRQNSLKISMLVIERGTKETNRMTATIPDNKIIGENTFTVTVTSLGNPSQRTVAIVRYNVVYPMLDVISVELDPSRPGPMELVTVRVVLENPGLVELVDISVVLEGGGTERIVRIPSGGTATAVFTWISPDAETGVIKGSVTYGPGPNRKIWRESVHIKKDERLFYEISFPFMMAVSIIIIFSSMVLSRLYSKFINDDIILS